MPETPEVVPDTPTLSLDNKNISELELYVMLKSSGARSSLYTKKHTKGRLKSKDGFNKGFFDFEKRMKKQLQSA